MHKLFHRFGRKDNIKILYRELMFAHTCITLLSLGMIAVLSVSYDQMSRFSQGLIIVADVLLVFVALISSSIIVYIVKTKK